MRQALLILLLIVGLGAFLRLQNILQRDYWYDEAFTGITVRQPVGEMMDIVVSDVHPPLYYLLLKAWTIVGDGPFALRFFSVIFGLATIVLAYVAVREWTGKSSVGLLAAFVIAINPFLVGYSQEARMYSLLAFLLLLAAWLLARTWQRPTLGNRLAYGAALAAVCLTHYLGLLFAVCLVLADLYCAARSRHELVRWLFGNYSLPLLAAIIWLPWFLQQFVSHGSLGWVPNRPLSDLLISFHAFFFGAAVGEAGVPPLLGYCVTWLNVSTVSAALFVGLMILVIALSVRRQWNRHLALLAWMSFTPIFLTWSLQIADIYLYVERYLIGTAVFLMLFVVVGLSRLKTSRRAVYAFAAFYFLFVLFVQPWPQQTTFPRIVEAITPAMPTTVVFTDAFGFTVGRYYLGEDRLGTMHFYNQSNPTAPFVGWATIPEERQIFSLPDYPHVLVTDYPEAFPNYQVVDSINGYTVMQSL